MTTASVGFELIKENMIKPSNRTPPSLQHYKLSLVDQILTSSYVPVVLFFPKEPSDTYNENDPVLEKSLSELLTSYYPFAGRKVGDTSVECNDMGVLFREVRLSCSVSELLAKPHASLDDTVFPVGLPWGYDASNGDGSLIVAQLSHFDCGGKALSLCMSHKLGDGATLFNFLSDWAAIVRNKIEKPCPLFNGAIIYPPIESQDNPENYEIMNQERNISMRIVFGSSQIKRLKALATTEAGVDNPTRVEVLTALLTKSFLATSMVGSPSFKPIVLFVVVNLRSRTSASIQQNSVGNFFTYLTIPIFSEEDMKWESLVAKLRSEKVKNYEKYKGLNNDEVIRALDEDKQLLEDLRSLNVDFYTVTSMCGFPYQDLDFGLGKPLKVSFSALPKNNYFILVNDHTGKGVEAIATLEERVLSVLEKDQEFCSFATLEHPITTL